MALLVEEIGAPAVSIGFVLEDGAMRPLAMEAVPDLTSAEGLPAEVEITLIDGKKRAVVTAFQTHVVPYWLQSPVGFSIGASYENPEAVVLLEGPAIIKWQGEDGFGWLERLRRVRDLENLSVTA